MNNVLFVRYSPHNCDPGLTAQVVECYRDVFADGPWHEWLRCPVCKKNWGAGDKNILEGLNFMHCGVDLEDFWPREEVRDCLRSDITSDASCWLAMNENLVVGFCLGYPISVDSLEKKLGISFDSDLLRSLGDCKKVAYQDDIAVRTEFRRQGIAAAMFGKRLSDFASLGLEVGVVRTREKPEPSVTFPWYTAKLGYEIVAKYPESDGRVILAQSLNRLAVLL